MIKLSGVDISKILVGNGEGFPRHKNNDGHRHQRRLMAHLAPIFLPKFSNPRHELGIF